MSWLSNFMHPGQPYQDAADQVQQYYGQAQGYLQPYMDYGTQAGGQLTGAMGKLLNPVELQKTWADSYELSPQAKQDQEFARQQGLEGASAMGLMGSSPALTALQRGGAQIAIADRKSYMDDLMQKYIAGTGIGQNIFGVGANTATTAGHNALTTGDTMGGLAGAKGQAGAGMLGQLIGAGLNLGTSYLTGGMGKGGFGRGAWSTGGN